MEFTIYPHIIFSKVPVKPGQSRDLYILESPCRFIWPNDSKMTYVIPKGFVTDFASIPKFLWSILPPHQAAANPSVVHDFMYTFGLRTRKEVDDVFYVQLVEAGVKPAVAKIMWSAVRAFGKSRFGAQARIVDNDNKRIYFKEESTWFCKQNESTWEHRYKRKKKQAGKPGSTNVA